MSPLQLIFPPNSKLKDTETCSDLFSKLSLPNREVALQIYIYIYILVQVVLEFGNCFRKMFTGALRTLINNQF